MKQVELHIFGKVQGIFFRAEAKNLADELGIVGWIRNEPDESVTVIAQSESEKALQELLKWCQHGPQGAKVERVEEKWSGPSGPFVEFEIYYA